LYGAGGKPSWFLQLSPKGQVPVLVDWTRPLRKQDSLSQPGASIGAGSNDASSGGRIPTVVVDSEVILDYVATNMDASGDLLPVGEGQLAAIAEARAFINDVVMPAGRKAVQHAAQRGGQTPPVEFIAALSKLEGMLAAVAGNFVAGGDHGGARRAPVFLAGDNFTLADISAAPILQRLHQRGWLDGRLYPLVTEWWHRLEVRPSVAATVLDSWWWWW